MRKSVTSVILTDSSTGSPVHVLMLSIQAVRGLPLLRAPSIVPCIMSFFRQLPLFRGVYAPLHFYTVICIYVSDPSLLFFCRLILVFRVKNKVLPYSLPSVAPGADPGVQTVSPPVTF